MKRIIKRLSITLVLLLVSIRAILFFMPLPPLLGDISFSRAVYADQHELLRMTLSHDAKYRLYVPLAAISPYLVQATLLQEDQYYRWHPGVNPIALLKAIQQTYLKQGRRMGASTITMQVARIRYGINSKTLVGKIRQLICALQLEMHYNKNQILEAYLNLAPYGNNIEGVGAASLIYFGKDAKDVTVPEALTLAVIPQNPSKRVPVRGRLKEVRNKLFARWVMQHPEDINKKSMLALPLQMQHVRSAPFLAPHFVDAVLANTEIGKDQIVSTLNLPLQKLIERVTQHYLERNANLNVNNAAVLLLDTRDMGVKALLGSANFFNRDIGGQINGTEIRRSPGSTLKPFIYALAIDQGLIHPATVLKDVPRSFGSYNPENFDYDFAGPITAKDALILSRNIPAVYLADQLKHPSLYQFLRAAEIRQLKSEQYYGLALVLGGAEMSMHELVSLYAILANDGKWKPLRYSQEDPIAKGKRILSAEASFLVLDMLKETHISHFDYGVTRQQPLSVAWKTGTSSGYRDAWTFGVVGPYVLGIWVGNFDNRSNPAFIGKEIAAPLFFEIASAINTQFGPIPSLQKNPEHMNLTKVDVCKASGMLPTQYCHDIESTWFIPGVSPIKSDTTYREVAIDRYTGLRTCKIDQHTKFEIYEFWTSDLLKIFKQAGIQRRLPPAYDESCKQSAKMNSGNPPQIISPQTQTNYLVRLNKSSSAIIPFSAIVDADVRTLHWFVNETYLGKTLRDEIYLWQAKPGKYTIRVVDDMGRTHARTLNVKVEV